MTRSRFECAITSLRRQGIKYDLDRMRVLDERMGHPHRSFRTLHVTGTNGKGSTSAFLASTLQAAGYRVGLNTSPHLVSFRERVRVNGRAVDDDTLLEWFEELKPLFDDVGATFFEAATAIAFHAFAASGTDVAVIEVGLGGRLDASNVIEPVGSIITGVELEHTRILGDTVEAIAREKAGIIKSHPVVSGVRDATARRAIEEIAAERGASVRFLREGRDWAFEDGRLRMGDLLVRPGLQGRHQAENAAMALALLDAVHRTGALTVPPDARAIGIAETAWPGRFDRVAVDGGEIVFDVAHNAGGAAVLLEELRRSVGRPVPGVIGMLRDKTHRPFLEGIRPAISELWVTTPPSETRSLDAAELAEISRASGYTRVRVEPDPERAARAALEAATEIGVPALVTGSLFTVGAAMDGLGLSPADQPAGWGRAARARERSA